MDNNNYLDKKGLQHLLKNFLKRIKDNFLTKEDVGDGISIDEDEDTKKIRIKLSDNQGKVKLSFDEDGGLKANFDGDISGSDATFELKKDENSAKIILKPSNSLLMLKGNDYIKVEVIEEGEKTIQLGLEDISIPDDEIKKICKTE